MSEEIFVRVEGSKILIKTPYDAYFVNKLKKAFTDSERHYDESQKMWIINYSSENYELVNRLVQEHFFNTEEKLVVFKCNGGAPYINDMPLIKYSRDSDYKGRAWNFDVIYYSRMGDHGSRRYPKFEGIVIAKVLMNSQTKIDADEYKVYPYTKSLHMTAVELAENAKSISDYDKIVEKLDKMVQKLEGFSVEIAEQAVIVKGFLVLSQLPSKALLDKMFPKYYKDTRIGSELIQIVRGYFYNKLGVLSRKFYNDILGKYAVNAGFGYIVPASQVYGFIRAVEDLREEYKKFEEELRNFIEKGEIPEDKTDKVERGRVNIDPEYLEIVREYLREHGVEEIEVPKISERVKIRLIPFSIDMKLVEEYLEDRAIEKVQRELEEVRKEMVENLKKELEEKVNSIFERLKDYEKKKMNKRVLKKLREDIDYVLKTSEELGVYPDRLEALKRMAEAVETGEEKVEVTEAEGRLKALLKEILS